MGRLMALARILNPKTPVALGCARPPSPFKLDIERLAVRAGVNALAYPSQETVHEAERRGLRGEFSDMCCSLL